MKNISKPISIIFLSISIFLFLYVFYRSEIFHGGIKYQDYYLKYYLFSLFLIISSIISFFINNEIKIKISIFFITIILGLYCYQGYLLIKDGNLISDFTYDTRDVFNVYKDLKKNNPNIVLTPIPRNFIEEDNQQIFPLSGISKRKTIGCNENGYYSIFNSDRYGFNNPDSEWDKKEIKFLLIGDSMVHGSCVNQPDTIGGNLRKITTDDGVLSLGQRANGSLIEYATLKEYLHLVKVNRVLWVYYEGNDLIELGQEIKNKILSKYLNDDEYSQNLHRRQNEIDKKLQKKFDIVKTYIESLKKQKTIFPRFFKFYFLRRITFERFFIPESKPRVLSAEFKKIIKLSKSLVEKNQAKLYFVYIPEIHRYIKKLDNDKNFNDYEKVVKFVNNLNIPVIDVNKELFNKQKDKLSLFPFRSRNHFTEKGYKLLAETIYKKIKEFEEVN